MTLINRVPFPKLVISPRLCGQELRSLELVLLWGRTPDSQNINVCTWSDGTVLRGTLLGNDSCR